MRTILPCLIVLALAVPQAAAQEQPSPSLDIQTKVGRGRLAKRGIKVLSVAAGKAGDMMGLEPGDVIISVNNRRVRNQKQYQRALLAAGSICKISVNDRRTGIETRSCHFFPAPGNSHLEVVQVVEEELRARHSERDVLMVFVANSMGAWVRGDQAPDRLTSTQRFVPISLVNYPSGKEPSNASRNRLDSALGPNRSRWPERTICIGVTSISAEKAVCEIINYYDGGRSPLSRGGNSERWTLTKTTDGWQVTARDPHMFWD